MISHILSRLRTTSRGVEVNSDDNKMISNGSIQRTHNRRNGSLDLSSPLGSFGIQPRMYNLEKYPFEVMKTAKQIQRVRMTMIRLKGILS